MKLSNLPPSGHTSIDPCGCRLIRSSFKSGAVLRKLEVGERPRPGYWVEVMKGKSRVLHLQVGSKLLLPTHRRRWRSPAWPARWRPSAER